MKFLRMVMKSVLLGEPKIFTRNYAAIRLTGASGAMLSGLFVLVMRASDRLECSDFEDDVL